LIFFCIEVLNKCYYLNLGCRGHKPIFVDVACPNKACAD